MTIEILTAILVILTAVYAFLTHRIAVANESAVAAMKSQVVAATRPYVHFDIRLELGVVEAVLVNRGVTAARSVEVRCEPLLLRFSREGQQPAVLPRDPIPLLIPNREIVELLGSWNEVKSGGQAVPFKITLSYSDIAGAKYVESYDLSAGRFAGMLRRGVPESASELRRIAEACEKFARSSA